MQLHGLFFFSVNCASKVGQKGISANSNTTKILLADSIGNLKVTLKVIKMISSFWYHTSGDAIPCFTNVSQFTQHTYKLITAYNHHT